MHDIHLEEAVGTEMMEGEVGEGIIGIPETMGAEVNMVAEVSITTIEELVEVSRLAVEKEVTKPNLLLHGYLLLHEEYVLIR